MKYIDADKLRAEIEQRKDYISVTHFAEDLLSFLDGVEEEPIEGLDEAAREYATVCHKSKCYPPCDEAFKAGAEWQKAKMLEGAEECELYWDGDFLAIDLNMRVLGYSERDKVNIIILPKED